MTRLTRDQRAVCRAFRMNPWIVGLVDRPRAVVRAWWWLWCRGYHP